MHFSFYLIMEFSLVFGLIFTQISPKAYAREDRSLFVLFDMNKATTGRAGSGEFQNRAAVEKKLAYYRSLPTTLGVHLIKINFDLLNSLNSRMSDSSRQSFVNRDPHLVLNPQTNKPVRFNNIFIQRNSQSQFRLEEDNTRTMENVSLDVYPNEKVAWGHFVTGSNSYYIRPLEGDIHALIQFDKSKSKPDIVIIKPRGDNKSKSKSNRQACNNINKIRVIVVNASGISKKSIRGCIADANSAFRVSGINNIDLELAHIHKRKRPDRAAYGTAILGRFIDGEYIPEIHDLRNTHKADIAVLFVNLIDDLGGVSYLGSVVGFNEAYAFAVMEYDPFCDSFIHEIGHVLGAHHDKETIKSQKRPYNTIPYGHGFIGLFRGSKGYTRMAYSQTCGKNCTHFRWFSTKSLSEETDNARVLRENACKVAGYR